MPPPAHDPTGPAVALTKFRRPRLRREVVERTGLLDSARVQALDCRLLLVQAPAGFGKTTLLVQLTEALAAQHGAAVAWVSLDADDNDANRLFAAIFGALAGMSLDWAVPPTTLLAELRDAGPAARAALVPALNALAHHKGRCVIVLDDLHHVNDAAALQLLDHFIDRLPPEVGLCIGSRLPPALSLPRWRVRGELAELGPQDLQFDALTAQALRRTRGLQALPDELLQAAMARTQGWAAGLQLLLGQRHGAGLLPAADGPAAQRHLFDFFAQEVLAELPAELQDFVLQCSVLPELQPALCEAVTGRTDASTVLEGLYRRQLFLTALDEALPVLRFHDLFLDFLRAELARRQPAGVASLHARAAAAETRPERAVHHWLAASRWSEALAAMHRVADALLASGGVARLEKWLAMLPAELQAHAPEVAHLQGMCAWSLWDWRAARPHFRRAVDAYRDAGQHDAALAALGMLGACHNALGDLAGSRAVLQEVQGLDLAPSLQVRFDSLAAWSSLALGEPQAIGPALARMADHVALAPATRYPNIVDMGYGHFVGVPGTHAPMQRLLALCAPQAGHAGEVQVPSMRAWLAFWHGERHVAEAALAELLALQQHMPGDRMLALSATHLLALHRGARGDHAAAIDGIVRLLRAQPVEATQTAGWLRTYLHVQARLCWLARDATGLAALLPRLDAPRLDDEWPVLEMGAALVRGRHALLTEAPAEALPALEQAVALHARWRMPAFIGDPRLALAAACLQTGNEARAVAWFAEVLLETADEPAAGALLLEPAALLQGLWEHPALPHAARIAAAAVRERLASWTRTDLAPPTPPAARTPHGLTEREDEVLGLMAQGQSNKHIAHALGLSPHTVKRHVANIMDKLGASTRTQAAGHWHRR